MKRDYNKPLIEVRECDTNTKFAALDVSTSPMNWTDDGTNNGGYKEFEW